MRVSMYRSKQLNYQLKYKHMHVVVHVLKIYCCVCLCVHSMRCRHACVLLQRCGFEYAIVSQFCLCASVHMYICEFVSTHVCVYVCACAELKTACYLIVYAALNVYLNLCMP